MTGFAEVLRRELGALEKLHLHWRASRDVRAGRFKKENIKRTVAGITESLPYVSSPFTVYEPQRYRAKRQKYLSRKKRGYQILDRNQKLRWIWADFQTMRSNYHQRISDLQTDITMENLQATDRLESLEREKEQFDKLDQLHMSQLCINKAEKLRSNYYAKNAAKYRGLKLMIERLQEGYDHAEGYLLGIRTRTLTRMGYYYYRASNKDNSLGHYDMTEERLALVTDLPLLEEYQQERQLLAEMLEKIDADLAELNSWHG